MLPTSNANINEYTHTGNNVNQTNPAASLAGKNRRYRKSRMRMDLVESPVYNPERMDGVMDKQEMTLSNLAELADVDCAHLSRVFKGTGRIGLTVLIKVAYVLKISPSELFPYDFNSRKTNGQRFDEITKELDLSSSNYLLLFCSDYVKEWRRIKEMKG